MVTGVDSLRPMTKRANHSQLVFGYWKVTKERTQIDIEHHDTTIITSHDRLVLSYWKVTKARTQIDTEHHDTTIITSHN